MEPTPVIGACATGDVLTEERLRAVFNEIDADCGGTLDMEEIANAFRRACPSHIFHRDPAHCCTGTGLTPATSAPGLGSPLPHLHRDWARPCAQLRRDSRAQAAADLGEPDPEAAGLARGRPGGAQL